MSTRHTRTDALKAGFSGFPFSGSKLAFISESDIPEFFSVSLRYGKVLIRRKSQVSRSRQSRIKTQNKIGWHHSAFSLTLNMLLNTSAARYLTHLCLMTVSGTNKDAAVFLPFCCFNNLHTQWWLRISPQYASF